MGRPGNAVVSSASSGWPLPQFQTRLIRPDSLSLETDPTWCDHSLHDGGPMEANMGLLDVLNGMQNGPRGQRGPSTSSGGMSPITMAVLGLLAYKALKHFGGQSGANPAGTGRAPT